MLELKSQHRLLLERDWDLPKIFDAMQLREIQFSEKQKRVFLLLLCYVSPEDISKEVNGTQSSGAIRNMISVGVRPKVESLCNLLPEATKKYADIPFMLAKYGYTQSKWHYLYRKAIANYDILIPNFPKKIGDEKEPFMDIVSAFNSEPEDDRDIRRIPKNRVVDFDTSKITKQTTVILSRGTSGSIYCLMPSIFSPNVTNVNVFPDKDCEPLMFDAIGTEEILIFSWTQMHILPWLEVAKKSQYKLCDTDLDDLIQLTQEDKSMKIQYTCFRIIE